MYAITGITGQVGGNVARALLAAHQPVRAVVRDARKGVALADTGYQMALADMADKHALADAFHGAAGVFILLPPQFDPSPGFPESRAIIQAVRFALEAARPAKVVCLSTIGAQVRESTLLTQLTLLEEALATLPMPVAFLRPGCFMENYAWDVASARQGVISSFLQPLDKPVPMVATADVGRAAADLLGETWSGVRVVELEGPARVSPSEVAESFGKLLRATVRPEAVPRETWETLFRSQGMTNPLPRMRMVDGFNEGWIEFENGPAASLKGVVPLETVLKQLVERDARGSKATSPARRSANPPHTSTKS